MYIWIIINETSHFYLLRGKKDNISANSKPEQMVYSFVKHIVKRAPCAGSWAACKIVASQCCLFVIDCILFYFKIYELLLQIKGVLRLLSGSVPCSSYSMQQNLTPVLEGTYIEQPENNNMIECNTENILHSSRRLSIDDFAFSYKLLWCENLLSRSDTAKPIANDNVGEDFMS